MTVTSDDDDDGAASPAHHPRRIPARFLPVPDTVSAVMQKIIAVDPERSASAISPPQTAQEWRTLVAEREKGSSVQIAALCERLGVSIRRQIIGGVNCHILSPNAMSASNHNRVLLNLHGGGHVFWRGETGTVEAIYMAGLAGFKVIAVDYRMPPDFPFPAAMDDAMAVWKEVTTCTPASNIGLFGYSSGAAMVLSMVQRAKREGLASPAAIMAATPWSDLSMTGDSYFTNAGVDNGVVTYEGLLAAAAELYANGRNLKDPLLSPVYGDFMDFPPTFMVTGTRDLFLSNTIRVHRKLRQAGVEALLDVYEGQSHGPQYLNPDAPETIELFGDAARFFDRRLGH